MAYRLPPLATFRTFEAAARHLSFKKAAEELHVTPAAVSQQIKQLENYLGVLLFQRRPHALKLSEDGLLIFPNIRDGLDLFAAAVESTRRSKAQALNVVAPPSFAARWLVPRLARFSSVHPDVAIRISSSADNIDGPQTSLDPKKELLDPRRETGEVAIRFGMGLYPGYQVEKILTPDYVLVCSPRLLTGEAPLLAPQDLSRHILIHDESILLADQRPSWQEWFNLAGIGDIDTERGPRFSNTVMVLEAVLEGQGVGLVLTPLVEADVAAGRLCIPFDISLPSRFSYFFVMSKAVATQPMVIAFRQWLYSEVAAAAMSIGRPDALT